MEKLKTHYVALQITTVCTLKCKLCSACIPYCKEQEHFNTEEIFKSLDTLFDIFEYIEKLDISGGEPLTNPDVVKIVKYALKYKEHVGAIRLITNGTLIPSEELISVMASDEKLMFIVDDYGELSRNKETVLKMIEENNINLKLNMYHGDDQLCGGWVDQGKLEHKGYTDLEVKKVFRNCFAANFMCLTILKGKMYHCIRAGMTVDLGICGTKYGDVIDLIDDSISIDEKRTIASNYGKQPVEACYYCNGFNSETGERFPAAEQVK